ncbi:hypothetical protein ASF09_19255 [Sphingomonas sp. Leaf242]|nr:hypothetical protein ASF09_19255 [Sphingomonas sp. Leaf242]
MFFGMATFAQRFAVGVGVFPGLPTGNVALVVDLQNDVIASAARASHAPLAIELDDFISESSPI